MTELRTYFNEQQDAMVALLTKMIEHETFSIDKPNVDRFMDFMVGEFEKAGAQVTRHEREEVGDIVQATWQADAPGQPILLLGHADTVWPEGTLAERPVRIDEDGRLYGPGALDMKGGLAIALFAIKGLLDRGELPNRPIHYLLTTDEEIGSKHSQQIIEDMARESGLVLVLEPPTADGSLKGWRKGTASYTLTVTGKAAHAGNEPEKGINAIIEFAQQALVINELNDLKMGTSVCVNVVHGGMATNVIPDHLTASIDVRVMSQQAKNKIDAAFDDLHPFIPGAQVKVEGGHYRPPMERNDAALKQVKNIASGVGMSVHDDGAGGGSDGNFTAAIGIPTVDGLGPEGLGLHALHEHVIINSMPRKATLIAAILRDWED
ncbi:M20 family metallopeptidase [Phototrophicus methaneseepsis]|uniref:M20 family metallopeptidase n=1 Tax=Phototrophicus methaneseepsis TaxID=2710758 RepID=A0A7S8IE28_9CHLR|nr:M20 family metallopeptidase [Phototrophicus methaneseepsis]QPC82137.1 M20 family metallopeptidase [Phototrophicus methaneseepsis]